MINELLNKYQCTLLSITEADECFPEKMVWFNDSKHSTKIIPLKDFNENSLKHKLQ